MRTLAGCVLACSMILAAPLATAKPPDATPLSPVVDLCGNPFKNHFGPFDYRTASADNKEIVERFHFTSSVERLESGSTGKIGQDLGYTLHVFPNHPRALYAVSRYSIRHHTQRLPGITRPAECYFDRAVRFAPDDPQVRALYADFLIQWKRPDEARKQLEAAQNLDAPPQARYNLALAWANLGDLEKALPLAKEAYAAGVQFPGLRDKLKAAGAWRD